VIGSYLDAARKTFVFQGRSGRTEFWSFTVINLAVLSCLAVADQHSAGAAGQSAVGMASGLCFLALSVPQTAVTIRRLHDTDRSARWVLIAALPFIGVFVLLGMAAVEGDQTDNRYGPSPGDRMPVAMNREQDNAE